MQKFVVKKISRPTNITLSAKEETSFEYCVDGQKQQTPTQDLEKSSIKMCGYLKKKRNRVGGWTKLYFVLQNSLLMSYNSKDDYEKKLVSFKDVICLIPGNTVLIPSLEPRFTIASNLNTFYIFRCDDNKICSKWITAILECLSRDISKEYFEQKTPISTTPKNFLSQQNLSHQPMSLRNVTQIKSWENLQSSNWLVNHNGRILLELNYINANSRAKLPIAAKTASILQKCTDDVIPNTKKVNFFQNDENENFVKHIEFNERGTFYEDFEHFRLHNTTSIKKQSPQINQIEKMLNKSESQRPKNLSNCLNNDIGTEIQEKAIILEDEYSSVLNPGEYQSVDSTKFHQKLTIDNTYSEIANAVNVEYATVNVATKKRNSVQKKKIASVNDKLPEYATVDVKSKFELRKMNQSLKNKKEIKNTDGNIYEDIGTDNPKVDKDGIYELIDIPLRPSRRARSLVWKNWSSRITFFDFAKRFRDHETPPKLPEPNRDPPSSEAINKRQKQSLTFSDLSKRFNYRSMRKKAELFCSKSDPTHPSLSAGSIV